MKRIAFVLGSMGRGGAERVISILSRSYAERGYETDIILLLSGEVGYELHETTRVLDFSGSTSSRIKRLPMWLKSIRKYVKENEPDVIVSFTARINVIVNFATTGLKTRLVVSERNDPRYDGRSRLVDILTKMQYPRVDAVVFQTKRAKDYFNKLDNSVIIPNPINVSCKATNEIRGRIVTAGRLTKQKNQRLLIDAFNIIKDKHEGATLEIYGEGTLREELTDYIASLGISDRVTLPGNKLNIHEELSSASIFALSSDYEGLSNAQLEAMMMGLALVSTNCAGADEYIVNGESGFIVDVGDTDAFAKALDTLLSDDVLRQSFRERAQESSRTFSYENVMAAWDKTILGEEI